MSKLKHIIESQQFDRELLEEIFNEAEYMEYHHKEEKGFLKVLQGKVICTLFLEESTRTRLCFESAAIRLGAQIISTSQAKEYSAYVKGDTPLEDLIRTIQCYADAIILRHKEPKSAEIASRISLVPIINAGDGPVQHPTQAVLDAYTINSEIGKIDNVRIALVGDLKFGRTVRSLAYLLTKFNGVKIYFVSPDVVKMKDDVKDYLLKQGTTFVEEPDLKKIAKEVDVIYQTRIQKERFQDSKEYEEAYGKYVIDKTILGFMKKGAIIMHPFPRSGEILSEVDIDLRAAYFRQIQNGLYVRMALLKMLLL